MESTALLSPVTPVQPAAGYIGGKRNLSRRLVAMIDRIPHGLYAEPCVGMGGIFFRRRRRPKVEVINDISGDVATLFRVLQEHYAYLIDMLRFRVASRAEFQRLIAIPGERLTDLQRAARFLYLQKLGFGGQVSGRTFGVSPGQSARFNVTTLEPMLADIHERLAGVTIEQLSWSAFIPRYDRPETLFYFDPPYWGCEDDYGNDVFSPDDFAAIAAALTRIKGRFIVSINDVPQIREIFGAFHQIEARTTYTVGGGSKARSAGELIITNVAALEPQAANDG